MAITDWPLAERPREKLLEKGCEALSDAELLAIFLRTGVKGKTAVDLARDLIQHFGSLRGLLDADLKQFSLIPGLGKAKYVQLQAVIEIARRHMRESLDRRSVLTDPFETRRYLFQRLRDHKQEVFACLFLDSRYRIITYEELFRGTIHTSSVHPREIVKRALHHNAACAIIAHNHPSGCAQPSQADRLLTQEVTQALSLVDVRVLDHIVVGDNETVSFVDLGWM